MFWGPQRNPTEVIQKLLPTCITFANFLQFEEAINSLTRLLTCWNSCPQLAGSYKQLLPACCQLVTAWKNCLQLETDIDSLKELQTAVHSLLTDFERTIDIFKQLLTAWNSCWQLETAVDSLKQLLTAWNSRWKFETALHSLLTAVDSL